MICAAALCLIGAIAVDGDTFRHDGQRYRLLGIQAPERDERGYARSKAALAGLIAGRTLTCDPLYQDRYGRPVVQCWLPSGADLSCAVVSTGAARDWPKYSGGAYEACEP